MLAEEINTQEGLQTINVDLREKIAVLEERLRQTEGELQDSERNCEGLGGCKEKLEQQLNELKLELTKFQSQPPIDPHLPEQFKESQRLLNESRTEVAILQVHDEERSTCIQGQQYEIDQLQEQISELRLQEAEAKAAVESMTAEKAAQETETTSKIASLRTQFIKATEVERTDLATKHTHAILALRSDKEAAQGESTELRKQLESLKDASQSSEEAAQSEIDELHRELEALKRTSKWDTETAQGEIGALHKQLAALDETSRTSAEAAQGEIGGLNQQLKALHESSKLAAEAAQTKVSELQKQLQALKEVSKSDAEATQREAGELHKEIQALRETSKSSVEAPEIEIANLNEQLQTLKNSLSSRGENDVKVVAQLRAWEARCSDAIQERDFLRAALDHAESELEFSDLDFDTGETQTAELRAQLQAAESAKEEIRGKFESLNKSVIEIQNKALAASEPGARLEPVQMSSTEAVVNLAGTLESILNDKSKAEQEVESLKKTLSETQSRLLPILHNVSCGTQTSEQADASQQSSLEFELEEVQEILFSDSASSIYQRKADESQELPYNGRTVFRADESQQLPYLGRLTKPLQVEDSQVLSQARGNQVTSGNDGTKGVLSPISQGVRANGASLEGQLSIVNERTEASQRSQTTNFMFDDSVLDYPTPWTIDPPQPSHQAFSFDEIRQITSPMGDTSQLFPSTPIQRANTRERRSSKPLVAVGGEGRELPLETLPDNYLTQNLGPPKAKNHSQSAELIPQNGSTTGKRKNDPEATLINEDDTWLQEEDERTSKRSRLSSQSPSKLPRQSSPTKSILRKPQGALHRKKSRGRTETKDLGPIISPKVLGSGNGTTKASGLRRVSQRQSSGA